MREAAMRIDAVHAQAACYAAALALTLVLAAWLTPRRWWRRPNLQALAVLGGGTLAFGALFAMLAAGFVTPTAAAPAQKLAAAIGPPARSANLPAAGARYRVAYALNLRQDRGVHAARVAVLPAGSTVTATGAADGDWWQVRATVGDAALEGWTSSLWLRRTDEGRRR
jgi:hypothetical protein